MQNCVPGLRILAGHRSWPCEKLFQRGAVLAWRTCQAAHPCEQRASAYTWLCEWCWSWCAPDDGASGECGPPLTGVGLAGTCQGSSGWHVLTAVIDVPRSVSLGWRHLFGPVLLRTALGAFASQVHIPRHVGACQTRKKPRHGAVVAGTGIEPVTFHFSGERSYQLSYPAICISWRPLNTKAVTLITASATPMGLEPTTSAVTGRRANQLRYGASSLRCPRGLRGVSTAALQQLE